MDDNLKPLKVKKSVWSVSAGRSCSWSGYESGLRAARRQIIDLFYRSNILGFRICRPFCLIQTQVKRWQDETEGGLFDG